IGFEFLENFNYPYIARTVTEFWRRWHISLSSFFRDYVYIPLGGNRRYQLRNIFIVWCLTGFWHGASWNFVLWGLYYGILLIIEKLFLKKLLERIPRPVGHIYTLLAALAGWGLFYFTSGTRLLAFFKAALGIGVAFVDARAVSVLSANIFLLPALFIGCTPLPALAAKKLRGSRAGLLEPLYTAGAMAMSFTALVGQSYNPFLYFRF
ncbi:MAG: MBOAT family protein, partial [Clostridiales bacterium]|nr:MBOAT family protein [Clostridiales bacterium]